MANIRNLLQGTLHWDRALITDNLSDAEVDLLITAIPTCPEKVMVVIDHDTPAGTVAVAAKQRKLRDFAEAHGLSFHYGQGIGYHLAMEALSPGEIVICSGRHASTVGAAGAVGLSLGAEDLKAALECGTVTLETPLYKLQLEHALPRHTSATDLALHLIKTGGFDGRLLAIHGPQLSCDQRVTLCNLLANAHVKAAFFTDSMAGADMICDLSVIYPLAVLPGGFDEILPAARIDGLRVNQVFIGGCAGGTLESLRKAAAIWQGKQVSRYVRVMVSPATAVIYAQAIDEGIIDALMASGALIMNQGCGACWAQSQGRCDEQEVFLTTGSINCANWAGKQHNRIYITSVEHAARAALTGSLYEN